MLDDCKKIITRKLVIRLGGNCNLACKYCHSSKSEYGYNPDIIEYMKRHRPTEVVFSGGEPLLYFDVIKLIVESSGLECQYKITTNASVLTAEMVDFFNKYNFIIYLSYDGSRGVRVCAPIDYDLLRKIARLGLAVCVYEENINFVKLGEDVKDLAKELGIGASFFPNFIHETRPDIVVSNDTIRQYVKQLGYMLEIDFIVHLSETDMCQTPILERCVYLFSDKGNSGVRCCRPDTFNMTISGKFLLCPYGDKVVGDIYMGVDWDLVEGYLPERCKGCELLPICRNQCVENVTEHECVIFKSLYRHFYKLLDKYKVTTASLGMG